MTGAGLVFLGAIGFSAKAILIKLAYYDSVDPITLLSLRMGFSLPFFLIIALWKIRQSNGTLLNQTDWIAIVALGSIGYYLASYFDFLGLQYISAGLERLILFIYPTFVVLLTAFFLKQPVLKKELLAILLSYTGIMLVVFHDLSFNQKDVILGSGLVFVSALSYAVYLVGSTRLIEKMGATRFTSFAMTISSVAVIFQFLMTRPFSTLRLPLKVYELSLAMALFSTVLPTFLISKGIHRIGASRTSIIGSTGPVITIGLAYLFLGESVSILQLAGTALVLLGTLLVSGISAQLLTK
ncbi:MAG: DMT family transporter [Nitrospirae bacterium]|nr:DMT family transporter [Nitrospirota bacterium]MBI3594275.1 DMT family transporter [Nitrospirota bacterium]